MPGNRNPSAARAGVGVIWCHVSNVLCFGALCLYALVAVTLETRACTWDIWHLLVDILHACGLPIRPEPDYPDGTGMGFQISGIDESGKIS